MIAPPQLETPSQLVESSRRVSARALGIWVVLVLAGVSAAALVGLRETSILAPPFHARFEPIVDGSLVLAVVVGVLVVAGLPVVAARARWSVVVTTSVITTVGLGILLAGMRGWDRVVEPVRSPREYLAVLPTVSDLGRFLESFTDDRIVTLPVHVQGHPPGPVAVSVGLREIGLGGPGWFTALLVAAAGVTVAVVLVAVRDVAGEHWARRAAPFLVVSPALVWLVTSADALFAGIGAVGVTLVVLATGRRGIAADVLALVGGVVLGVSIFFSYGLVLLGVIPLVVAWRRRRARPVFLAAGAGAAVVAMVALTTGFWWLDGLATTRERYAAGIASRRPYAAFLFVDLAAFALVLGPATAAGLARLRDRRLWWLVGGGLACVGLALLSGMAKGEVERIWLPFAPWVLVAGAAVATGGAWNRGPTVGRPGGRAWLGAQLGLAILIESLIRTPW